MERVPRRRKYRTDRCAPRRRTQDAQDAWNLASEEMRRLEASHRALPDRFRWLSIRCSTAGALYRKLSHSVGWRRASFRRTVWTFPTASRAFGEVERCPQSVTSLFSPRASMRHASTNANYRSHPSLDWPSLSTLLPSNYYPLVSNFDPARRSPGMRARDEMAAAGIKRTNDVVAVRRDTLSTARLRKRD